ncbi:MAG TPA: hypothetical protein VK892_15865 [Pyrinomonadaceae bacterium]|nr:hypothetical protein [Pyrinomonadaceae bacterium]
MIVDIEPSQSQSSGIGVRQSSTYPKAVSLAQFDQLRKAIQEKKGQIKSEKELIVKEAEKQLEVYEQKQNYKQMSDEAYARARELRQEIDKRSPERLKSEIKSLKEEIKKNQAEQSDLEKGIKEIPELPDPDDKESIKTFPENKIRELFQKHQLKDYKRGKDPNFKKENINQLKQHCEKLKSSLSQKEEVLDKQKSELEEKETSLQEINDLEKQWEQALKEAQLFLRLDNVKKRKEEEKPEDLKAAESAIKNNIENLKTRLSRLQAKTPVDRLEAKCENYPHQSSYDRELSRESTEAKINRGGFSEELVRELHGYVNDARLSETMREILGIKSLPDDFTDLWMLGTLVCWDTVDNSIKILFAASGYKVKPKKPEESIWCSDISTFRNFNKQSKEKWEMRQKYEEKFPYDEKSGTLGNCAAPKMLGYAAATGGSLIPMEMAEMAFEPTSKANHGKLMPSCPKCRFCLGFWLDGLKERQPKVQEAYDKALKSLSETKQ